MTKRNLIVLKGDFKENSAYVESTHIHTPPTKILSPPWTLMLTFSFLTFVGKI